MPGWGLLPDPRLAAWTEGCAISRAFAAAWPTEAYAPTAHEFPEMVAAYMGATPPLAARLGVGRPHSGSSHTGVRLDRWAFVLEVVSEPRGRCVDTWRSCHDALPTVAHADALRAGGAAAGAGAVRALGGGGGGGTRGHHYGPIHTHNRPTPGPAPCCVKCEPCTRIPPACNHPKACPYPNRTAPSPHRQPTPALQHRNRKKWTRYAVASIMARRRGRLAGAGGAQLRSY